MQKEEMTPKGFGQHIKRIRIEKEWSQGVLATQSGVAQPTISNLENGRNVGADAIDKILKVLGVEDLPLSFPRRFIK